MSHRKSGRSPHWRRWISEWMQRKQIEYGMSRTAYRYWKRDRRVRPVVPPKSDRQRAYHYLLQNGHDMEAASTRASAAEGLLIWGHRNTGLQYRLRELGFTGRQTSRLIHSRKRMQGATPVFSAIDEAVEFDGTR